MRKRKLSFIFGTRPEIIKLSPLISQCRKDNIPFFSVHTGQHYSYEMDEIFFRELHLPLPKYKLRIKSSAPYKQGEHTGKMLIEIERILLKEMPYCVVVQGDTNTVLAGALTAEKISTTESFTGFHIKVAHVEAGLRSFNRLMPEETNRFITDHLSDFLFTPTAFEKGILLKEGVPKSWIHVTGNTIVDAVQHFFLLAKLKSNILQELSLEKNKYILLTLHRQENVDTKAVFNKIIRAIERVSNRLHLPVIFPIHPRTAKMLKELSLEIPEQFCLIQPLGFLDFIWLEANAGVIMTDSGGVQEEACILKVPCVTLRTTTERPETVQVGANIIAGISPDTILKAAMKMYKLKRNWHNPLGDGKAASRMLRILMS